MDFPETGTSRKKRLRTEAEVDALDAAPPPPSPPLQAEENSPSTSRPNNEVILEAEIYFLKREVEELKKNKTVNQRFNFEMIKNSDDLIILHTGLPNKEVFEYVLEICTDQDFKYCSGWAVTVIDHCNQLLMTLMKLKQNVPQNELAFRFQVSRASVSNIISTWIDVLHQTIYVGLLKNKIPSLMKNKACLPNCFSNFTSCRIIIDCTEVYCAVPAEMSKKQSMYSNYKHRYTLKGLVGVAPNGVVTYISDLYGGSTSDKKITQDCGVLSNLVPGDVILADKGFLISDIVPEGVLVNIPPFLETPQFTSEQALRTRSIARARIHVERAIGRIKGYSILEYIPHTLMPFSTKVWQVCGALTNFQYPLIKEVEVFYKCGENVE
ncbi:uncharacterized protein LOC120356562 [Nilaparvata lugens]|uniref:uncharacterized protein LOC120356562 n=1 Tax=Nilaparvata lugens TaxID=108931 RepID=UPI00193CC406|nr:uncharacterized protein LOC120356562 [Nilaparvata lugens]